MMSPKTNTMACKLAPIFTKHLKNNNVSQTSPTVLDDDTTTEEDEPQIKRPPAKLAPIFLSKSTPSTNKPPATKVQSSPSTAKQKRKSSAKKCTPERRKRQKVNGNKAERKPDEIITLASDDEEPLSQGSKSSAVSGEPLEISDDDTIICVENDHYFRHDDDDTVEYIVEITGPRKPQEPPLLWTVKYRPKSSSEVVGQIDAVNELKHWLKNFYKTRRSLQPSKKRHENSDEEENDQNSCFLIQGAHGLGKTSLVHSIAIETGSKVFEMNCSSRRSGKIVTETLQEVTQSNRLGHVSAEEPKSKSLMTIFQPKVEKVKTKKKRKRIVIDDDEEEETTIVPKDESSQEKDAKSRLSFTANSFILFDDVDVVFEEDEGFWRAVKNLIRESKVPVIFTASTFIDQILDKLQDLDVVSIKLVKPSPSLVVEHLKKICEEETIELVDSKLKKIVDDHNCDIRRCINELQFWTDRVELEEKPHEVLLEDTSKFYDCIAVSDLLFTKFCLASSGSKCQQLEEITTERNFAAEIVAAINELTGFQINCKDDQFNIHQSKMMTSILDDVEHGVNNGNRVKVSRVEIGADYLSGMNDICITEGHKLQGLAENRRRTRRFLHYLDTAGLNLKPETKSLLETLYDQFLIIPEDLRPKVEAPAKFVDPTDEGLRGSSDEETTTC